MADVTKEIALEVSLKDSTSAGTQSAKQRLREMQKELIAMAEAGQQGTDAFKRLEQQAGQLKDEIADVNQRIKNLASDTKRIDAFVGAVQGIAAGFQIAQGAAALFGDENEDLQKAMLKVQGAMALANGVQQVANLLQKESAVMMGINTTATKLYAVVVGTATGAMRAFRIALAATGIGAAVVAVGLLVTALSKLKTQQDLAAESAKKQAKAQDDLTQSLAKTDKQVELNVLRAKNAGKTEKEIAEIENQGYLDRAKANEKFVAQSKNLLEKNAKDRIAQEVRAANPIEGETARERYIAREQQFRALSLALTKDNIDKRIKLELAGNKELNDKLAQAEFDALINREKAKASATPAATQIKESPEVIRIRREIEVMQAKGAEESNLHQKRLEQIDVEIKSAKTKAEKEELEHKRVVEIAKENHRLDEESKKLKEQMQALEKEGFDKTVTQIQYAIELKKAQGATDAEIFAATIESINKEREAVQLLTDEKVKSAKLDELASKEAIARATEQTRITTQEAEINKQIADFKVSTLQQESMRALELKKITSDALAQEAIALEQKKQTLQSERDARLQALQTQFGDAANFKQLEQALNDDYRQKELTAEQESAQKILQIQEERRRKELEMASNAIAALGGLLTAGLGQSERDQRKAFEINKKASIAQALINTYQAVTAALTAGGNPIKLATGRQFVEAGIALAAGLANVAKINATQFQGGGGGGGGSTVPAPAGGGSTTAPAQSFANPNTTMLGNQGQPVPQPQGSQPMRAYVVERDIQQTTSRVRRLSEFATLG